MEFKITEEEAREFAEFERSAGCDVGAGFDWGISLGSFLTNTHSYINHEKLVELLRDGLGTVLSREEIEDAAYNFQAQLRDRILVHLQPKPRERAMSNPLLYAEEHFVVLETDQPEQIITAADLFEKLKGILADRQDCLPQDVQRFTDLMEQTTYLMSTACELDLGPDQFLQWYAVRLEK